jgi:ATP-dependent Clp protease protease subunit
VVFTKENDRPVDIYQELLKSRIIYLGSEVNAQSANLIVAELLYLESKDPDADITMYINSPGGVIDDGMAIFDTMQAIKPDVSTVCIGMAASMASFLLAGGTKGKRYAMKNSQVMIHQPLGGMQGQTTEILIEANHIKEIRERMNRYYSEFTGQDYDTICKDTERNNYMTADEAKAYGLVDHIVGEEEGDE